MDFAIIISIWSLYLVDLILTNLFRCDNHYVIEAKTPDDGGKMVIEFEQEKGFEHKMFIDEREATRKLQLQ